MARLSSQQSSLLPVEKNQHPPESLSMQIDASQWGSFVDCLRKVTLFDVASPRMEENPLERDRIDLDKSEEEDDGKEETVEDFRKKEKTSRKDGGGENEKQMEMAPGLTDPGRIKSTPTTGGTGVEASGKTGTGNADEMPVTEGPAKSSPHTPSGGEPKGDDGRLLGTPRPLFLQQDGPNDPFGFKNSVLGQEAGKTPFFQANTSPSPQGFQLPPDLLSSMVSASHDSQWAGLQFAHASPKAMSSLERSTSTMTVGMNPTMEKSEVHAGLKTGDQGKGQQDSGQRQNQGRPGSTPSPNGAEGAGDASSKARKEAGDASRTAKGQESSNLSKQIDRVRLVQRVSSAFRSFAHQNGTVRIKLHPQELGSVTVRLQMQQGAMTAHLETETEAVQKALMENLPDLRERLGQQNIKIEHFQVEVVGQQTGGTSSQAGRERGGKGGERSAESLKRMNAPSRRSAERGEQEPARPSREESPSDPARQLDVRI